MHLHKGAICDAAASRERARQTRYPSEGTERDGVNGGAREGLKKKKRPYIKETLKIKLMKFKYIQ